MNEVSLRHSRWVETCIKLSMRNTKAYPYRYAGLLVKGGRVISYGFNRVKNNTLTSNSYYRCKTVHCEVDVLRNVDDVRGCILYIGGVTKAGNLINTKPCFMCYEYLKKYFDRGLRLVCYHNEFGEIQFLRREGYVYYRVEEDRYIKTC